MTMKVNLLTEWGGGLWEEKMSRGDEPVSWEGDGVEVST